MMKSVLIAIRPKWCEKIASGKKTIEVRKSRPKIEMPFKCYIYRTTEKEEEILEEYDSNFNLLRRKKTLKKFRGKVIGEFICDKVYPIKNKGSSFVVANEEQSVTNEIAGQSCLYYDDMVSYFGDKNGYGWHISDLKIYDKPRELSEFRKPCDWNYDCCTCKRAKYELTKAEAKVFYGCDSELTRPPQSWMYIEDLGEVK